MTNHKDWCEEHGELSSHRSYPSHRYKSTLEPNYAREKRIRKKQIQEHPENFFMLEKNKCPK